MFSAENMYSMMLETTNSKDKAEEAYTEWVTSLGNKDKVINIDSLGFTGAISEMFGKQNDR